MAAGDFYFAINATFRFLLENFGKAALIEYWRTMGREHYAPLAARFRGGGLPEVEHYWRDFFEHEPGAEVSVTRTPQAVDLDIRVCPAIAWLRAHDRAITPGFCEHCTHVSEEIAAAAGMRFALEGGGGACRQRFALAQEPPA